MKYFITTVGVETEQMSLLMAYIYFFLIPVTIPFYFVTLLSGWLCDLQKKEMDSVHGKSLKGF